MAGSPVVETTSVGVRPATCGVCARLVGGTGQNAQTSNAPTGPSPGSENGAAALARRLVSAATARSVVRSWSWHRIAVNASWVFS